MSATPPSSARKPVSLIDLRKRQAQGNRFAVLTCYDATTAGWLAEGGVDVLLVGDTAAEMILGFPRTLHAPLDFMIQITAAVKRGAPGSFVIGDMPFLSYQCHESDAVKNAGRFLTEGCADAVKLEVEEADTALVARLCRAGIPVIAHLGARPQQVARQGGYRSAGKTPEQAGELVSAAQAMAQAGCVMLLLEATTAEATQQVVEAVDLPVIGCGAGPACHGKVVVLHDLLGLSRWQPPFAPPQADLGRTLARAAKKWADQVARGQ